MPDTPLSPEDRDALIAELALGVLGAAERADALRQLMADPRFAPAMIDEWDRRLEPLYSQYIPIEPPSHLWTGIEARITGATPSVVSVNRRLRFWRVSALVAGLVAASLALVLVLRPSPSTTSVPTPYAAQVAVAQLTGAPNGPVVLARFDPVGGFLALRPSGIKADTLKPELWIIPGDGKPRSLGLISRDAESHILVEGPLRAFMTEGATLAVTMEQAVGAPHAAPSSAPVASGKISLI
ncbi:anti-sigma factor [Novosphingobium sp. BL-8H]|uniref:anti-sigma factor n=1 Tax=Novosphingobium sp. BL-8H TaxID=3127640 RepID=UPI003756B2B3